MRKQFVIPLLAAGVLALSAFFGLKALGTAQASAGEAAAFPSVIAHRGGGFDNTYLADALGITTDELDTAYQSAAQAAVEQALAEGLITQAQADELLNNDRGLTGAGRWGGWLAGQGIDYDALLAEALGISVEQLNDARLQARLAAIDQAITDGRLTEEEAERARGLYALENSDTFRSAIRSAYEQAVQQAVAQGVITQSQADAILSQLGEARLGGMFGGRGGPGGFGGRHGRGPGLFTAPDGEAPDSSAAPEVVPSRYL